MGRFFARIPGGRHPLRTFARHSSRRSASVVSRLKRGFHPVSRAILAWLPARSGISALRKRFAVDVEADVGGRFILEHPEDDPKGGGLARGDVVGLPRFSFLEKQGVGPHDIPDIGIIAPDREISDLEGPFCFSGRLDHGDLASPVRANEVRALAGAGVGERPGDDDREASRSGHRIRPWPRR